MSFRSFLMAGAMSLAVVPASHLMAQESVERQPDVQNSKFQFEGEINSPAVYVRSGPGEGYYATMKLDKGTAVTVVGIKFDWLKITPPDGSFCYVAKAFVEKRGEGNVGRVNKPEVNVRAGSMLNAMKTTVQARLNVGDDVQILGEQDEYFKIKPPEGAYLYVNKQFVDPVRALTTASNTSTPTNPTTNVKSTVDNTTQTPRTPTGPTIDPSVATTITPTVPTTLPSQSQTAGGPTTQPDGAVAVVTPASTQPAAPPEPTAEEKFAALEQEFSAASAKPLDEQPAEELGKKYQTIANASGLSDTLKRVVDFRIATLKARSESKAKLIEARQIEKEASEKQLALQAEQQELEDRLKQTDVQIYSAVGTLQPSSLQLGNGGTLYRLTDPATGRTVIYIRSTDQKVTSMIGVFVGVKGDPTTDSQLSLRVINPTDIQQVDPAKVNGSVAAQILPPSLMAKAATASTGSN